MYVIDIGPHEEIGRKRERFLRATGPLPGRREQMQQAEEATAQEILTEGGHYLPGAEQLWRIGRPEREIVNCAAEWASNLLVICSRARYNQRADIGPKSVGHVARFVLDHAPCPVLLVRPTSAPEFPASE